MLKKLSNTAFIYTVLALVVGVVYREYTKLLEFTGQTNLSLLHTHLFTLGMMFFLIVLALEVTLNLSKQKYFNVFFIFYNVGLSLTVMMMAVRGFLQINGEQLSKGLNASIAGISGIGHILLSIGLIVFFINLKQTIDQKNVMGE